MISNKEKNFVSAVIYVRNNENEITKFLDYINSVLDTNFEKYEIICVNDSSTDKTVDKIKTFSKSLSGTIVSVLNMSYYHGVELSMNAGIDLSIGDFVYEFDSVYMDYPKELMFQIYKKSLEGFDIVKAVPNKKNRFSSKIFYSLFNTHSTSPYKLATETFQILSRRAINRIQNVNNEILYRKAVYASCGLSQTEVSYTPLSKTLEKKTEESEKYRKKLATDSLILFTDIAYRFSIAMSFIMMIATALIGIYALVIFFGQNPVAGWTTTILFLAFGFFCVFSIMTIIIKYLSLLVELNFKKQNYVIESIEKITR